MWHPDDIITYRFQLYQNGQMKLIDPKGSKFHIIISCDLGRVNPGPDMNLIANAHISPTTIESD